MTFESDLNEFNRQYFFREFTYAGNNFKPAQTGELQLADSLIWIGDSAIVFQLKERDSSSTGTQDEETTWFQGKVKKTGSRQIRDTIQYLDEYSPISVTNGRGHTLSISKGQLNKIHKVVCFAAGDALPDELRNFRFHISETVGVIHFIPSTDYWGIVRALLTPAEVSNYLLFREALIQKWNERVRGLPEQALVGQYLKGDIGLEPGLSHLRPLTQLQSDIDRWDIGGILEKFGDRIISANPPEEYYPILVELAKLKRRELIAFKERFLLVKAQAEAGSPPQPYRFYSTRTECAFVFVPIPKDNRAFLENAVANYTIAAKHDFKASKCIGVAICPEENGAWLGYWGYIESEWERNPEIEKWLREFNPFLPVQDADFVS
jgi:hypothetical protein